jgi:hypothetical protein
MRENRGFLASGASLDLSLLGDEPAFAGLSLRGKIPFPAQGETGSMTGCWVPRLSPITSPFRLDCGLGTNESRLIIVCLCQKRSSETSPSNEMWLATLAPFREFYDEFVQMISALQRLTPLQRVLEMESVALRAEWQPEAIFMRLRGRSLASIPTK